MIRAAVIAMLAACAPHALAPAPRFTAALTTGVAARDLHGLAALFAPDADAELVAGPALHGRTAIDRGLASVLAGFTSAQIAIGRQWIGRDASVVELVLTAHRGEHAIGVAGAVIVAFDPAGLVTSARLYLDLPTLVGQIDPAKLPEGAQVRTPLAAPPAGTAIANARGTAGEAANLATTGAIWARLDAHDPAGVLATTAPGYRYDDFSGPAPLDTAGTRALLDRFLALVPDFAIAAKPTYFAAGDDVITESVEHMTFRGRAVTLHGLDIKHFVAGKVAAEWQYANGAEAMAALFGATLALP